MSQANPQNEGGDVESSNEASSGIVITNGPDGIGEEDEPAEVEQEDEENNPQQAENEESPTVEDGAAEANSTVSESEGGTEEASDPEGDGVASPTETDADAGSADSTAEEETTETATEEETENGIEEPNNAPASDEIEEGVADEDNTNTDDNSETNMSETDTDTTTENESSSEDLAEVSGTPAKFEATIQAGTLQELINSVDVLVDECKIRLGDDRVGVRAVDPANVGMVDVDLEAKAFESYVADPGILGVNLDRFADVVGLGNKGDLVHLNYDAQTRKLHISVGGVEYTLAMIDPDSIRQEPDIPDLQLPVEVTVETDVINQGVTAADMVSDHIGLGTQRDGRTNQLVIEAEGDTDDVELVKGEDADAFIEGTFNGNAGSLFSLDYLKDMNRALPNNGVATLEIGDEFPLKMHFDDDDGQMHTTYMLAPRIQSD